ncbi:Signal transduction histidine kinase [Mucilaginibacter sp. OK098]|nr:Signal transduction histidine kinase [Mucilaginibacter sp. OK098]
MLLGHICYGQLASIRKIQQQLPFIHDSLRYVDALNRLGTLLYEKNVDSTFYYTVKARAIADRLQYTKGKADAANNLGILYDMKGNLQLSLRYYNDAYNIYSTMHDTSNVVQIIMNIASVYQELGKNPKAVNSYKTAISIGKKLSRDSIMSLVLYNYVLMYPDSIHKDSIPVYIDRARQIASKYNDKRVLLAIDQLTAEYYIKNGQRDKGVALLQQTVANVIKSDLYYLSLDMLIDLGNFYAATDSAKAIGYYSQGLQITKEKGFKIYTEIINKKIYDFYLAKKDNAMAFHYSQQLLILHDEQEQTDNASGIDYIEYALKDQQLSSARTQSKYQQNLLILVILLFVMTIVIIVILWRNWKKSGRTAEALRLQFKQSESTTEALEVMNNNYARLIKIVAHDLRNPIGAINTISSMIQPGDLLNADTQELISLVKISSKNCLELINELLETDFDPQQNLKKENIDLDELLTQCIHLLSFRAKDKDQQLNLAGSAEGSIIQGDREKLWRVINNLVINAIKFSPEGCEINIQVSQSNSGIIISVTDTGIGIPVEIQSKIFDPFTAARRKGTGGEQPFGLGLYISKQIIEAHNGKIWFTSDDGRGTTFYLELPKAGITS